MKSLVALAVFCAIFAIRCSQPSNPASKQSEMSAARWWQKLPSEIHKFFLHQIPMSYDPKDSTQQKLIAGAYALRELDLSRLPGDTRLDFLAEMPNLETLRLTQLDSANIPHVQRIPKLKHLIFMGYNTVDAGLSWVFTLKNLETLDLGEASYGKDTAEMRAFAQMPNLRTLRVAVRALENLPLLREHSQIKELHLRVWDATELTRAQLEGLPLRGLLIEDVNEVDLEKPLGGLTTLEELSLRGHCNGDLDLRFLVKLPQLKSLNLSYEISECSGGKLLHVEALASLKQLESLEISSFEMKDIKILDSLSSLRRLHLRVYGYPSRFLRSMPNLVELHLAPYEQVDTSDFINLTKLENLELISAGISDLGFLRACPNLRVLDISYNPIKSLEPLRALQKLEEIDLTGVSFQSLAPVLDLPALRGVACDISSAFLAEERRRLEERCRICRPSRHREHVYCGVKIQPFYNTYF